MIVRKNVYTKLVAFGVLIPLLVIGCSQGKKTSENEGNSSQSPETLQSVWQNLILERYDFFNSDRNNINYLLKELDNQKLSEKREKVTINKDIVTDTLKIWVQFNQSIDKFKNRLPQAEVDSNQKNKITNALDEISQEIAQINQLIITPSQEDLKSEEIKTLQKKLIDWGLLTVINEPNGILGQDTVTAIAKFLEKKRNKVDDNIALINNQLSDLLSNKTGNGLKNDDKNLRQTLQDFLINSFKQVLLILGILIGLLLLTLLTFKFLPRPLKSKISNILPRRRPRTEVPQEPTINPEVSSQSEVSTQHRTKLNNSSGITTPSGQFTILMGKIENQEREINALKQIQTSLVQEIRNLPQHIIELQRSLSNNPPAQPPNQFHQQPQYNLRSQSVYNYPQGVPITSPKTNLPVQPPLVREKDEAQKIAESYQKNPELLLRQGTRVNMTQDTINHLWSGARCAVVFEENRNGDYLIVKGQDNQDYLLIAEKARINTQSWDIMQKAGLFSFQGEGAGDMTHVRDFSVLRAAKVYRTNSQTWELVEEGQSVLKREF